MKTLRLTGVLALAVVFAGTAGGAGRDQPDGNSKEERTLVTGGVGKVKVLPDTAQFCLMISASQPTAKEARQQSEKEGKKVADAIAALKLEDVKVAVTKENMEVVTAEMNNLPPGAPQPIACYRIDQRFVITLTHTDFNKLKERVCLVLDAGTDNGATVLGTGEEKYGRTTIVERVGARRRTYVEISNTSIEYSRSDLEELQRKALTLAARDAQANAKALADGTAIRVRGLSTEDFRESTFEISHDADGHIVITARVRIECTY